MSKRYLVIQTAFLCSTIFIEPVIETIKTNDKDSFVAVMVIPQTKDIFSKNPNVDLIITYDKHENDSGILGLLSIIKTIKKFKFDVLISAHGSIRTSLISFFSQIPKRVGFADSNLNFVYTHKVQKDKNAHELDKNLSLAEALGFNNITKKINLCYSDENRKFVEGIFEAYSIKDTDTVIGINPSAGWPTKRWPKEYYKKVAKNLVKKGYFVIITGIGKDNEIAEFVKDNNEKIINLSGNTKLNDLFYLISKLDLLISNDSSPIHIASAFNIPTIDIYGPTSPSFGFYPLSDIHKIMEIKNLSCRPCAKNGSIACKHGHIK